MTGHQPISIKLLETLKKRLSYNLSPENVSSSDGLSREILSAYMALPNSATEEWTDFDPSIESSNIFQMVKSYMYLKVRMQFDPPTGSVASAFQEQIKEYEWRLSVAPDTDWSK